MLTCVGVWLWVWVWVFEWMGPPMGGPIPFHPNPPTHPSPPTPQGPEQQMKPNSVLFAKHVGNLFHGRAKTKFHPAVEPFEFGSLINRFVVIDPPGVLALRFDVSHQIRRIGYGRYIVAIFRRLVIHSNFIRNIRIITVARLPTNWQWKIYRTKSPRFVCY